MNVSATIIAFYLPVFIMVVLYFQVSKLNKAKSARSCKWLSKWLIPRNFFTTQFYTTTVLYEQFSLTE